MQETIVRCDVCKKVKGEGNNWLKGLAFKDFGGCEYVGFTMSLSADSGYDKDICSDVCAHKILDEFLAKRTAPNSVKIESYKSCMERWQSGKP